MSSLGGLVDGGLIGPVESDVEDDEIFVTSDLRTRVLTWSGPDGWRESRPRLIPRSRADSSVSHGPISDAGFSLVELLVALLVMGILLAIAIPTFLGTSNAADDRSAQSNLATALTDAKSTFENQGQTFGTGPTADASLATSLTKGALGLDFKVGSAGSSPTLGSSSSMSDVSVYVSSDGNGVVLAAYSVPGNCFYVVDNSQTLPSAVANSKPYLGTTVTTTRLPMPHGAIGLPVRAGTSYVTVAGDVDTSDCNAALPQSTGAGVTAVYQNSGFPSAPTT